MHPVEFRASMIAPITWTLIILFLGWPLLGGLLVIIGLLFEQADLGFMISLSLGVVWIALIWPYHLTLRVTLETNKMTKSSCFGSKSVSLNEHTRIRHRSDQTVINGLNLTELFSQSLSQEATTHIQITVADEAGRQITVGSACTGISGLRQMLFVFENDVVLPQIMKRLKSGERIELPPFQFEREKVIWRDQQHDLPLPLAPQVRSGHLSFVLGGKRGTVPLKKLWNPVTCLHLLSFGPPGLHASNVEVSR